MNLDADWASAVIAGGAIVVSLFASLAALRTNVLLEARNKRMDVLIHCIGRYEQLSKERARCNPNNVKFYFRRHWAVKREQLDFWLAGYVDPDDIISWFLVDIEYFSGKKLFEVGSSSGADVYVRNWEEAKLSKGIVSEGLAYVIENIRQIAATESDENAQRAALVRLLADLEAKKAPTIRRVRGHMGRSWMREFRTADRLFEAEPAGL